MNLEIWKIIKISWINASICDSIRTVFKSCFLQSQSTQFSAVLERVKLVWHFELHLVANTTEPFIMKKNLYGLILIVGTFQLQTSVLCKLHFISYLVFNENFWSLWYIYSTEKALKKASNVKMILYSQLYWRLIHMGYPMLEYHRYSKIGANRHVTPVEATIEKGRCQMFFI